MIKILRLFIYQRKERISLNEIRRGVGNVKNS